MRRRAAAARGARRPGGRPHHRRRLGADGPRRRPFFAALELSEKEAAIADKVLREIRKRLGFLRDVGLDYLTLDRLSSTLSGGESQRINLATSLGSALVDTLYVLDEPSIGLHSRDNERLIAILRQLRDQGNTVLVVEHDADMIRVADNVVDMGLGAGEQGGRVIFSGTLAGLLQEPRSLTAKYLRDELAIPVPPSRRKPTSQKLRMLGASEHNLKDIDVEIPLGMLTCVTGVSGSGKSTLVHDVIYAALKRAKGDWDRRVGRHRTLEGAEFISDVVLVDQAPIGRTPRSNPVTYLKAFDPIRELFASTKDARSRGLTASHFSFNVPGGRCEACEGEGEVRVEMQFLADVFVPCDQCEGKRFKPQVLDVKYRGRDIDQVLDMTVREALTFFSSSPKVLRRLQVLDEIGLGYLRLGQPATTLSGGEAQRIKIAAHLSSHSGDRVLYILDEPTTGLHFDDIAKLLAAFRKLIAAGHSLLVIEHNLDVIKTADWIIDLGPEGGEEGGELVAAGTPEQIVKSGQSHTGRYLRGRAGGRPDQRLRRRHCARAGGIARPARGCRPVGGYTDGAPGHSTMKTFTVAAAAILMAAAPLFAQQARYEDVVRNLGHPDPKVRLAAAKLLHESGYPEAAAPIAALIGDPVDEIQLEAIAAELSFFVIDEAPATARVARIVEKPRDGGPALTAFDRGPLAVWPRPVPRELTAALVGAMDDENGRVRLEAIYALGTVARGPVDARAAEGLIKALDHPDPEMRAAAAAVIGRLEVPSAGDALLRAINDSQSPVRYAAMRALGAIRDRRAVGALTDQFVVYRKGEGAAAALEALARIADPSSVPLFKERLGEGDVEVRRLSAEGLGRVGNPADVDALETAAGNESSEVVRLAMTFALQKGGRNVIPRLVESLAHDQVAAQAAGYLLELGPSIAGLLVPHLTDPTVRIRARVATILGGIGGPDAIAPLQRLTKDRDKDVALAAARAVVRIRMR